jgi:Na+-transporting NADH:ubiquinone oxidoreductase subunit NqrD
MRTLFIMSLVCALMSLLAIFGLSVMTVVPKPGAESFRGLMMLAVGGFFVAWLGLAFWVRARQHAASQSSPPPWLRRLLVCVSVVYLLGVFFLVIG